MNQARKSHAGNVAATCEYALKIPNGLGRKRIVLIEKSTAVFSMEYACESPGLTCERLNVEDIDDQNVPRMGAINFDGSCRCRAISSQMDSGGSEKKLPRRPLD